MSNSIKVTVYSTRGQRRKVIETSATTWGELRPLVSEAGYDLAALAGTDSINRHAFSLDTLDSHEIPTQDFTLFLRPTQTKSGMARNVSDKRWTELREMMLEDIREDESARAYYDGHSSGKNYTQLTTEELRQMVSDYPDYRNAAQMTEDEGHEMEASDCEDDYDTDCDRADSERLAVAKRMIEDVADNSSNEDIIDRANEVVEMIQGLQNEMGAESITDPEIARLQEEAKQIFGSDFTV